VLTSVIFAVCSSPEAARNRWKYMYVVVSSFGVLQSSKHFTFLSVTKLIFSAFKTIQNALWAHFRHIMCIEKGGNYLPSGFIVLC